MTRPTFQHPSRHHSVVVHERTAKLACGHTTREPPIASSGSKRWFRCELCPSEQSVQLGRYV